MGQTTTAPSATPSRPPAFSQIFKAPTNENGYEEWVQASDLIQDNQDVDAALEKDATLTFKRQLLAQPNVARALTLLRAGLTKPIRSPRTEITASTLFPELAGFRKLARLLSTEEYVAFADGRIPSAIESLNVGLRFSYRIQTDTLISGLVGIAVNSIVLKAFVLHLDQLSAKQCDQVYRLADEFLHEENPASRLLALERDQTLKTLETCRSQTGSALDLIKGASGADDSDNNDDYLNLQAQLTAHPQDINAVIDDASARIRKRYDQTIADLAVPPSQRKPFTQDRASSAGAYLANALSVDPTGIINAYNNYQIRLQLLAVHALIRRYQWEHNALPESLTDLHPNDLILDVYTGAPLVYQKTGDRYTLSSQGPLKRDDNGTSSTERVPVKLTP